MALSTGYALRTGAFDPGDRALEHTGTQGMGCECGGEQYNREASYFWSIVSNSGCSIQSKLMLWGVQWVACATRSIAELCCNIGGFFPRIAPSLNCFGGSLVHRIQLKLTLWVTQQVIYLLPLTLSDSSICVAVEEAFSLSYSLLSTVHGKGCLVSWLFNQFVGSHRNSCPEGYLSHSTINCCSFYLNERCN